jgi:quinol monooxygenase YgiN
MRHVVVARWRPREGQTEAVLAILRELADAIRKEPGNISFVVHRAKDDPNDILLYETYRSEQAFLDHREAEHFKTLVLERAVPRLAAREVRAWSVAEDI